MINLILTIIEVVAIITCMTIMLYLIKKQTEKAEYYKNQLHDSQKHNIKLLKALNGKREE